MLVAKLRAFITGLVAKYSVALLVSNKDNCEGQMKWAVFSHARLLTW